MTFLICLTLTANKVSMHPFQTSLIATTFSASGMMESLVFPISPLYFLLFLTFCRRSPPPPGCDRRTRFLPQPPGFHRCTRIRPTVMGITTVPTESRVAPRMGPALCSSTRALGQPQCPHAHALIPTHVGPTHVHTATRRCCNPSSVTVVAPHPRRVNPYYES